MAFQQTKLEFSSNYPEKNVNTNTLYFCRNSLTSQCNIILTNHRYITAFSFVTVLPDLIISEHEHFWMIVFASVVCGDYACTMYINQGFSQSKSHLLLYSISVKPVLLSPKNIFLSSFPKPNEFSLPCFSLNVSLVNV